ncbi:hypothetical protein AB205_0220060, partial [Aquarana catesbeiana]
MTLLNTREFTLMSILFLAFLYTRELTQVSVPIHVLSAGNVSVANNHLLHTREVTHANNLFHVHDVLGEGNNIIF